MYGKKCMALFTVENYYYNLRISEWSFIEKRISEWSMSV